MMALALLSGPPSPVGALALEATGSVKPVEPCFVAPADGVGKDARRFAKAARAH